MHAYLLMMMQPFMTMDDLSVTCSPTRQADLYKIADALLRRGQPGQETHLGQATPVRYAHSHDEDLCHKIINPPNREYIMLESWR
jgi:hypothetical protein